MELLIVIAIMAILAGLILPHGNASFHDQLEATARILMTDLAYARSLAVTHDSRYRIRFDLKQNKYTLEHCGTRSVLDTLPRSPFTNDEDPVDQHVVRLDDLPHMAGSVRLAGMGAGTQSFARVTAITFGPLGQTARSETTTIWLQAGSGNASRYLSVSVNPITGLATMGTYTARAPPGTVMEATSP